MRGEDTCDTKIKFPENGSPPHARGRLIARLRVALEPGITPACAGKTRNVVATFWDLWDHPRMRGEDLATAEALVADVGSPPHARGRL